MLLAVGITTAVAGQDVGPSATSEEKSTSQPPVKEVPEELSSGMGVFEQAQGAGDLPPEGSSENLAERGDAQPGENPELARIVKSSDTGEVGHLWPTDDGVCVSAENISGCARLDDLKSSGGVAEFTVSTPDGIRVTGFALDGVKEVTFKTAKGQETTAEIEDNFFSVEVPEPPNETEWVSPDGRTQEKVQGE